MLASGTNKKTNFYHIVNKQASHLTSSFLIWHGNCGNAWVNRFGFSGRVHLRKVVMIKAIYLKLILTSVILKIAVFSSPALATIDFQSQDPGKQLEIGCAYFSGNKGLASDRVEAAKWFRKAADNGNFRAMNILGVLYANGQGVPQNTVEAVRWFRKTAEQGDSSGMFFLGAAYFTGDGVVQNLAEGARWIRKAAERGNAYAMEKLGALYQLGQGVPQDLALATMWYRKSVELGNTANMENLRF